MFVRTSIEKIIKFDLNQLQNYFNSIPNQEHQYKSFIKGIILSKTNYGVIQESLF